MRQIFLAIVVILGVSSSSFSFVQPAQNAEQLLVQLHDAKTTDDAYLRLKFLAESDVAARLYLVKKLPEIITEDLSMVPIWMNSVATNAVRLAGDLKIAEVYRFL